MMRRAVVFSLFIALLIVLSTPAGAQAPAGAPLHPERLSQLQTVIEQEIKGGNIPGAVVIVGTPDSVLYRRAFGSRALVPDRLPMKEDTIFDIASVTKAVATTTAVMQLVEKKKLSLDAPVHRYWSDFKKNGKQEITVRHLLTHYSGLRADLKLKPKWSGYKAAMKRIIAEKPLFPPDSCYLYSDVNFEALGELVRRVSGTPLDVYCAKNIFKPLGMRDTAFKPAAALKDRIAPTQFRERKLLRGEVHDPSAYRMGGVAGHAGLFSTADDLALFARMLLGGGSYNGIRILKPPTVDLMTIPQSPGGKGMLRGLGWEIEAPLASNREELFPVGVAAHLGYTGTGIWVDPISKIYIVLLTNRVHPDGGGEVKNLRSRVKAVVGAALGPVSHEQVLTLRPSLGAFAEEMRAFQPLPGNNGQHNNGHQGAPAGSRVDQGRNGKVRAGIDVLSAESFASLAGLRIGLITNHTGLDGSGRRTLDLFYTAANVRLAALFSPEHGLFGSLDEKVGSMREPVTGLPVHSLYGTVLKPTEEMLEGLDALVFDIQDAGVRFYTYVSTMGYAMEAAAKKGIPFFVLDRPNPLTASLVQGPVLDRDLTSFTGYFPMPIRHGMTVGELAAMFNEEKKIGVSLSVVKMNGYDRADWYDETGLRWVNPSPNLRSLTQATLYPGVALVEGANVSVGRGTDRPFELLGAPWIKAERLADYLNGRRMGGVRFEPVTFTPCSNIYKGARCGGVRIHLVDRLALDSTALGIEIVSALYRLYPKDFQVDRTLALIGARATFQAVKEGQDPAAIVLNWQDPLREFLALRSKYLLY